MESLPDAILSQILSYLEISDVLTMSSINLRFLILARSDSIWQPLTLKMFGPVTKRRNWYATYRCHYETTPVFELLVPIRGLTRPSSLSLFQCLRQHQIRYRPFSLSRDLYIYLRSATTYLDELKKLSHHPGRQYLNSEDIKHLPHHTSPKYFQQSIYKSSQQSSPPFPQPLTLIIPDEIKMQIVESLDLRDIIALSQVNSEWSRVCSDEILWQKLFHRDFGNPLLISSDSAYSRYREAYQRLTWVQFMIRLRGLTTAPSLVVLKCLRDTGLTYVAPYQIPMQIIETEVSYRSELRRIIEFLPNHPICRYLPVDDLIEAAIESNEDS
jgi:hypothetical protein